MLRLPTIRGSVGDVVATAKHEQLSYRGFLAELVLRECDERGRRRSARWVKTRLERSREMNTPLAVGCCIARVTVATLVSHSAARARVEGSCCS